MMFAVLGIASKAHAITQEQSTVIGALEELGFENVTPKGVIGGDQEYRGTNKTPGANTTFWLKSDGTITFKNPAAGNGGGAAATAEQGLIGPVLEKLGFEFVMPKNGAVGGDMQYSISRKVSRTVRSTRFWLLGNGTITFEKPKGNGAAKP